MDKEWMPRQKSMRRLFYRLLDSYMNEHLHDITAGELCAFGHLRESMKPAILYEFNPEHYDTYDLIARKAIDRISREGTDKRDR